MILYTMHWLDFNRSHRLVILTWYLFIHIKVYLEILPETVILDSSLCLFFLIYIYILSFISYYDDIFTMQKILLITLHTKLYF